MENNEENYEKQLQLGADLDPTLVLQFRQQAVDRKFKKKEILKRLVEWWVSLDIEQQKEMYYQTSKDLNLPDDQIEKLWTAVEKIGKKVDVKINKPKRKRG